MTSQFSPRVFEVLELSRQEALRLESNIVGPEHLLLGILRGSGGPVNDVFARYETNIDELRNQLEEVAKTHPMHAMPTGEEIELNEMASNIMRLAVLEARIQNTQTVDVQHLLLAMLHDRVDNAAKKVLENNNINYEDTLAFFQKRAMPTHNKETNALKPPKRLKETAKHPSSIVFRPTLHWRPWRTDSTPWWVENGRFCA